MSTLNIKQNDTKPIFTDTPTINGVPMLPADLVGCSLRFLLKNADGTITVNQVATINPDGTFAYSPVPADVANVGTFSQEWQLTFPNAKTLTFPNNGYNTVEILADLG